MTTGRLAIGALRLLLENWLLSAVKRSGAVSPEMRATAQSTPVSMPWIADREVTVTTIFHFGAPSAAAASRNVLGTRFSMSSVVRTMTGIMMIASATEPAHAEKWPIGTTMI